LGGRGGARWCAGCRDLGALPDVQLAIHLRVLRTWPSRRRCCLVLVLLSLELEVAGVLTLPLRLCVCNPSRQSNDHLLLHSLCTDCIVKLSGVSHFARATYQVISILGTLNCSIRLDGLLIRTFINEERILHVQSLLSICPKRFPSSRSEIQLIIDLSDDAMSPAIPFAGMTGKVT